MKLVRLGKKIHFSQNARSRYVEHFGLPNCEVSIANHSLILLDAPGYADEDAQMHGQKKPLQQWTPRRGGALEFVTKFAKGWSHLWKQFIGLIHHTRKSQGPSCSVQSYTPLSSRR